MVLTSSRFDYLGFQRSMCTALFFANFLEVQTIFVFLQAASMSFQLDLPKPFVAGHIPYSANSFKCNFLLSKDVKII